MVIGARHGHEDVTPLERRHFFRLGLEKALSAAVKTLDEGKALRWYRPPFAQGELAFLLQCTRCDLCIEACPHRVLFRLPLDVGPKAAGTPAMALAQRGCHLCSDWPCVKACTTGALVKPADQERPSRLSLVVVNPEQCLPYKGPECGACQSVCPIPGALLWNGPRPQVDRTLCVGCALCVEACITQPKALILKPLPGQV